MSAMFSLHSITDISAFRHNYTRAPLNIEIKGNEIVSHTVTLFFDDTVLVERLVEAINKVATERRRELAAARQDEESAS